MPIYVFKCETCGHEFEKLMGLSENMPKLCHKCGKSVAQQMTSAQLHMRYSNMHPRHMRGQRKMTANEALKNFLQEKEERDRLFLIKERALDKLTWEEIRALQKLGV